MLACARARFFLIAWLQKLFTRWMVDVYVLGKEVGESSNVCVCGYGIRNTITKKRDLHRAVHNIEYRMKKQFVMKYEIGAMEFVGEDGKNEWQCGCVFEYERKCAMASDHWSHSLGTSKLNPSVKWINNDVPTYTVKTWIQKQIVYRKN